VSPPIIDDAADVAGHLGEVVTLRGVVARSKVATLLGVDVASDDPDLRGQPASATGRLEAFDAPDPMADGVIRAGRAAGRYLRLVDPATGGLAAVRATVSG